MTYSDRLIIESVKMFLGRKDVTVTEIAAHAHISLRTAKRALKRLEDSGQITRIGAGRRWGCKYEVREAAGA